ncbi:MAG: T9SS type A sorting domain-containing protein [Flavobacteriaceae bacterium]|nr:T9SS type A sorting domain-containing protein [Flavobacteriaceae bacterium]
MKLKLHSLLVFFLLSFFIGNTQTNPIPQSLPYAEDFEDLNHASEVWPDGIQGWRINNIGPSEEFFLIPAEQDRGLEGNATADDTGNMVYNFDQKIGFRSTSGGNNFIALALNTLGYENITFTYDIMTIRNLAGDDPDHWVKEVGLQYRIGTSGDFTNIPNTAYQNPNDQVQTEGTTGQAIQNISITLPEALENQAEIQLRWVKREISGDSGNNSRPSFAIDNLEAFGDELDLNTFYYTGTGNLNDTENWSTNENGIGGASPSNFTNDDVAYIISNTASVTLDADWTVAGDNSLVILGKENEEITLIVEAELTADLLVENQATLQLENALIPNSISTTEGSSVIFTGDATAIPYGSYHHLTLDNIDPEFDGDGNINITGNMNLEGQVNMPDSRGADEYEVFFLGDFDQSINTNGNVFRAYEINIEKTQGAFNLEGDISTDSQLTFNFSNTGVFNDNGNTIYAGNSVNLAGEESSYNFTGTLILADFEEGIINGTGDDNNFNVREGSNDNAVATFNNIIVRAVNEDGQFRFRDGSTDVFKIKGDFIVESQVKGGIRFYENSIELGGDFIVEEGFEGTFTNEIASIQFIGETPQEFTNHASDLELSEIEINNTNGLTLNTDLQVSSAILFVDGNIFTTMDAGLYLENPSGVLLASEESYVEGPFFVRLFSSELTELTFPIGKAGAYRPVTLNLSQTNPVATWYFAEVIDGEPLEFTLGDGLEEVSQIRSYELGQLSENELESAELTLTFGEDDLSMDTTDGERLRIAHEQSGSWVNLGASINGFPTGQITTTNEFTSLGFFIIALEDTMSVDNPNFDGISIYPNPVQESLHIALPSHLNQVDVVIYNSLGKQVFQQKSYNGNQSLNLQNLNTGMYFLQVIDGNQILSKKIMKN